MYRLVGVDPECPAIIAKRSRLAKARTERAIYQEVLPHLPIPALPYYGYVEEEEEDFGWLFLAYADGEEYSSLVQEHRALAARWLGLVHTSAARVAAAARLPDRGPAYYLEHLRSARERILHNLANPMLTIDDGATLETVVGQFEVVVLRWSQVERLCERMPPTLIHGDFAPKNMRVRMGQAAATLLPFDWGSAGWGIIAADLAQFGILANYWPSPDLTVYCSQVQTSWPHFTTQHAQALATWGKIFRCLVCIDLDAESLATEWVEKSMSNMRIYVAEMVDAVRATEELG